MYLSFLSRRRRFTMSAGTNASATNNNTQKMNAPSENHAAELSKRCCGVKLYLDNSTGNQKVDGGIVEEIFRACSSLGVTLVAHCEDPQINARAAREIMEGKDRSIALHSTMRPPESEEAAIQYAIEMAGRCGTRLHIAHLSTAQGVELELYTPCSKTVIRPRWGVLAVELPAPLPLQGRALVVELLDAPDGI